MDNLPVLTEKLREWNKDTFGNIFQQKRRLFARIEGIQLALERKYSTFLHNLETDLRKELDTILYREVLIWFQKSSVDWMQWGGGDRNTYFFHVKTVARRKRNIIDMLQNDKGNWIDD